MPDPALERLAAEVRELHLDALEAARVAELCALAAGQRLLELRGSMRAIDWHKWVRSDGCPLPHGVLARYLAAARESAVEPL